MNIEKKQILIVLTIIGIFNFKCVDKTSNNIKEAEALISTKNYTGAINILKSVDDSSLIATELLGKCYFYDEQYDLALSYFNKAIERNKQDKKLYLFSGQCKENLRMPEEALEDYENVLRLDKNDALANFRKGKFYFLKDSVNLAVKYYLISIKNDSSNYNVFNDLALAYEAIGNYNLAIKYYSNAISINSIDAGLYFNRGVAYMYLQKFDYALEDLNNAIKIEKLPIYIHNRGVANYYLENLQNACVDWSNSANMGYTDSEEYLRKYCKSVGAKNEKQI